LLIWLVLLVAELPGLLLVAAATKQAATPKHGGTLLLLTAGP
jgi:hypothetical protein